MDIQYLNLTNIHRQYCANSVVLSFPPHLRAKKRPAIRYLRTYQHYCQRRWDCSNIFANCVNSSQMIKGFPLMSSFPTAVYTRWHNNVLRAKRNLLEFPALVAASLKHTLPLLLMPSKNIVSYMTWFWVWSL